MCLVALSGTQIGNLRAPRQARGRELSANRRGESAGKGISMKVIAYGQGKYFRFDVAILYLQTIS